MRYVGCALVLLGLALTVGCASTSREVPFASEACAEDPRPSDRPVAVVRTSSLQVEGEQAYFALYADGTASGLVVVNFAGGLLYGTTIPDSWSWLDADTVEICGDVNVLRNEVDFPPMERDCGTFPITGKELDLDDDGEIDLIETFTVLNESFYRERPRDG